MQQKPDTQSTYSSDEIQQEIGRNEGQIIAQMSDSQALSVQKVGDGSVLINARNVTFHGNGDNIHHLQNFAYLEPPPPLLPYLANRSAQEEALEEALEYFQESAKPYPFICVVHGNEYECHDMFLERLRLVSLPPSLGFDRDEIQIKKINLCWPYAEKNFKKIQLRLRKSLAKDVLGRSDASLEDVNQHLCKYPTPIMLMTFLTTRNWAQQGLRILDELLEFWRSWPDLNPNQKLIVCISITYEAKQYSYPKKSWLKWLFCFLDYLRGFSERRQIRRLNDYIHKQLANLHKSDSEQGDQFSLSILPELTGIDKQPVEEWVRSKDTRDFLGETAVSKLMPRVRKMFEAHAQETMPMEELADRLNELLYSLVTTKE